MLGQRTRFTTGTDEHGIKVQAAADAASAPSYGEFCEGVSATFRRAFDATMIEYDDFVRTTEPRHAVAVQQMWCTLEERGHIYLGEHRGWYCKSDEAFLTATQVEEVEAEDGTKRMVSAESGRPVELLSEPNYKFRLSAFQEPLLQWLDANPDAVLPRARYNEVRAWVEGGLHDLSISRLRDTNEWAIPVPSDPSHSIYVWLDALTNYLTVSGFPWAEDDVGPDAWPPYVHIVGKDILRFHAVYWPAFLMAAGLPLPRSIVAHAHFTIGRAKMSKSVGNTVSPAALLENLGVDGTRFALLRAGGMTNDAPFSAEGAREKVNNELADTLGNLLSRAMAHTLFAALGSHGGGDSADSDGVPRVLPPCVVTDDEIELLKLMEDLPARVGDQYDMLLFGTGIDLVCGALREANAYFARNEPWVLRKSDKAADLERLGTVLHVSLEVVRVCALLLQPVIPRGSATVLDHLGVGDNERNSKHFKFGRDAGVALGSSKKIAVFPKL